MTDLKPTQKATPESAPLETLLSGDANVDKKIDTTRTAVDSALTEVTTEAPVETNTATAVTTVQQEQKGMLRRLIDFLTGKKSDKKEEPPIPVNPQVQALKAETEEKLKKALNQGTATNDDIEKNLAA